MTTERKPLALTEDWTAVILGGLIIVLLLTGIEVAVPAFGWSNGEELVSKVLAPANLLKILIQFAFVLVIAFLAAIISGKPVKDFLVIFPLIYFLTVIALIIAGNSAVKNWNLEAVIFSLVIGLIIGNFFKLPDWFRKALSKELFVKIGLVLLGTGIIFTDILTAGSRGIDTSPGGCAGRMVFCLVALQKAEDR